MQAIKTVVDHSRVGRKGTPRHYQAFGMEPPITEVVVSNGDEKPVSNPPTKQDFTNAIQAHLDITARGRNYDSIQSAITYRGDPNPQFAAEADALFEWRSAVWTYAMEQLAAVEAGEREVPETAEAFIEQLPPFEWPTPLE